MQYVDVISVVCACNIAHVGRAFVSHCAAFHLQGSFT